MEDITWEEIVEEYLSDDANFDRMVLLLIYHISKATFGNLGD